MAKKIVKRYMATVFHHGGKHIYKNADTVIYEDNGVKLIRDFKLVAYISGTFAVEPYDAEIEEENLTTE